MATSAPARPRNRAEIDDAHKWNLTDIYPDWGTWDRARAALDRRIGDFAALKGTLAQGPRSLLAAYQLNDELGQLAYRVYFYPSLKYDEDQRDNQINARKQQVQALLARWQEASSWFRPNWAVAGWAWCIGPRTRRSAARWRSSCCRRRSRARFTRASS